jgi:glycosyltransferase involved in cell wall biosynthesis
MKKIAIIGNSDFNQLSEQLIRHLKEKYVFFTYHTSVNSKKISNGKLSFDLTHKSTIKYVKVPLVGRYLFSIIHALYYADVLLLKGITLAWLFPVIRILSRKKIILQIHHADIAAKKIDVFTKHFFSLKEKIALHYCHRIITSHESIRDHIAIKYNINAELIEQGVDHVERIETTFTDHLRYPFLKHTYVVSFFEEDSGNYSETVLNSFKQVKNKYLVMIGDWDKNQYSLCVKNRYAAYSNIFMLDIIYNQRDLDLIRSNAILYIHTSSEDNQCLQLLEAMSVRLPVLTYDCISNKYFTEAKATYFKSIEDIANFLNSLSMENLRKNSFKMKDIISERYRWSFAAEKYDTIFRML